MERTRKKKRKRKMKPFLTRNADGNWQRNNSNRMAFHGTNEDGESRSRRRWNRKKTGSKKKKKTKKKEKVEKKKNSTSVE